MSVVVVVVVVVVIETTPTVIIGVTVRGRAMREKKLPLLLLRSLGGCFHLLLLHALTIVGLSNFSSFYLEYFGDTL
jgi:hypothetical protein